MTDEEQIIASIKALGKGREKTFVATVEKNYPDKDIIDVRDILGTLYTDVRKCAAAGINKGVIITPVVNSSVIVSRIGEADELFVEMFSEVEKVTLSDDNGFECVIENGIISVKNKSYSLRHAFDDIIAAIEKLTVTTGVGPSGTPINIAQFKTVQQKLNNFLK
jgi:hypothetical protein